MRQHNVKPPSILLVEEVAANASKYVWFRPRLNSPAAITRPSAIIAPEIAIRDHKSKIKTDSGLCPAKICSHFLGLGH